MAQSQFDPAQHAASATVLALHSGRVGTWHWDLATQRLVWSEIMEHLHGLAPGGFEGGLADYRAAVHAQDRERVEAAIRAAVEAGAEYHVEYRSAADTGPVRWLEARGRVLRAGDGTARAMAGVCLEVTARKHAEQRLATQYAVTRLLAEADDLAEATPELLQTICVAVGWDVAEIWGWDPDSEMLHLEGRWCDDAVADVGFGFSAGAAARAAHEGLPGRVWSSGGPVWIADLAADPAFERKEPAAAAGLCAGFGFPIRSGRQMTGVISFLARDAHEPDADLVEMYETLGRQIGNAIERREAQAAVRKRAEQQTVVARLGQFALGRPNTSRLLEEAVHRIASTLGVEYAKILELQPNGAFLLRAGLGWNPGLVGHAVVPGTLDSQAGYTLEASSPVIVTNLAEERRFGGPPLLVEHGVASGISAVVHGRHRPFGVIGAHTKRRRAFTHDDANFLQAVANVVAMSIESGHAEETIRQLSTPILPLHEHMLILPVIGAIDAPRAEQLASQLLTSIRQYRAKVVVIDTTGAAPLESEIVQRLMKAGEAARLLGAKIIMTGISNEVGKALVRAGIDLSRITSLADLRSGVEEAQRLLASGALDGPLALTSEAAHP